MEPPETPRRPVTEELHGMEVTDPYRWLEADDEEVAAWTDAQNEHTESVLAGQTRDALEAEFAELARSADYGTPTPAGDYVLQHVREPDAEQPSLVVRDGPEGEARVLADPEDWEADVVSIDWFVPAEDGDLVAFGVAVGGTEQYDVHVADLDTGETVEVVPDVGRGVGTGGLAWTDEGFYYVRTGSADVPDHEAGEDGASDADGQLDKSVRFHELGAAPSEDRIVTDDVRETVWPSLATAGDVLVATFSSGWDRSDVYALDADPTDPDAALDLSPVLTGYDAVFEPTLHDGVCYVRTDDGASRSRVLAAPLAALVKDDDNDGSDGAADPTDSLAIDDLAEPIPESDAVLREIAATGDRILAHYHRDAQSELEVFGIGGDGDDGVDAGVPPVDHERSVDLDAFSSVEEVETDDGAAFFRSQSFDRPASAQAVDLATGEVRTLQSPDVAFDVDVEVSQEWFESADGTEIPAFVVRADGVAADGDNPALLTGYGGFRVNRTPVFDRYLAPFLDAGGVFALATLRGGTEYGEAWHEAGRREHKQHVFDDFLAVAEGLVDEGWASDDQLAITGGSNGGLLVGAALTQRPELFSAVLCRVPLLDMLRFHRFLLGASWTTEYGDPEEPEAFEWLHDYSPYHHVEATDYPATLLTTAAGDTRVHPCHARKTAARLQHCTTGGDPILLRVHDDTGHGVGKPRSMVVAEQAEQWTFLARHLGVALA
ncbi:prolyl oligopeptidase family serine peptidase [Haloparvum sp. AD34]